MKVWDVVWLVWFLLFVALELSSLFGAPWQTLSSTAWGLEHISTWFKILFLAGLCVLTAHICFGFPD